MITVVTAPSRSGTSLTMQMHLAYWRQFALDVTHYAHVIVRFDELFNGAGVDIIGDMLKLTPLQRAKMRDTVDPNLRHF